jgi:ankyrin repeat protein
MSSEPPRKGELLSASVNASLQRVSFLLDCGADIEEKDNSGDTPLNEAARKGRLEIVRLLVERGALLHSPNNSSKTAASWARENNHGDVARFLETEAAELQRLVKLKAEQPSQEWVLMDKEALAHVSTYPKMYRKITEIFNFESRERVIISENMLTRAEAMTPATSFDDLPQTRLEKVLDQFTSLGGSADRAYVLRGITMLDKPKPGLAS